MSKAIKVWGVPMRTREEVLADLKGATLYPDISGEYVVFVGGDLFLMAVLGVLDDKKYIHRKVPLRECLEKTLKLDLDLKKVLGDKTLVILDYPTALNHMKVPLNGVVKMPYGRLVKCDLKKAAPKETWTPVKSMVARILHRNAHRMAFALNEARKIDFKITKDLLVSIEKFKEATVPSKQKKGKKEEEE
jgi:hypothetical protein